MLRFQKYLTHTHTWLLAVKFDSTVKFTDRVRQYLTIYSYDKSLSLASNLLCCVLLTSITKIRTSSAATNASIPSLRCCHPIKVLFHLHTLMYDQSNINSNCPIIIIFEKFLINHFTHYFINFNTDKKPSSLTKERLSYFISWFITFCKPWFCCLCTTNGPRLVSGGNHLSTVYKTCPFPSFISWKSIP